MASQERADEQPVGVIEAEAVFEAISSALKLQHLRSGALGLKFRSGYTIGYTLRHYPYGMPHPYSDDLTVVAEASTGMPQQFGINYVVEKNIEGELFLAKSVGIGSYAVGAALKGNNRADLLTLASEDNKAKTAWEFERSTGMHAVVLPEAQSLVARLELINPQTIRKS